MFRRKPTPDVATSYRWVKGQGLGNREEWRLISTEDEIVGSITTYINGEWSVWNRGATVGAFASLAAAQKRLLEVFKIQHADGP